VPVSRARTVRRAGLLAGLIAVLFLLLLVGALAEVLLLVVVASLGLHAAELLLHRSVATAFPRQVDVVEAQLHARLLLEQVLVLVFLLRADVLAATAEVVVVVAVVVHQLLRTAWSGLQLADVRLRARRAELRNLPSDVPPLPGRPASLRPQALQLLAHSAALLPLALLVHLLGSTALVAPAAVAMALVALAVVASATPSVLALLRLPRGAQLLRRVHEAVLRHEPLVVLYSTGGPDDAYWVTTWLDTLEVLDRRAVVMLRDPDVVDLLPDSSIPYVCLPGPGDVAPFDLPTARVSLFVANGAENVRLVRNPELRSAFIGHGDSDKVVSASPAVKVYDEVWVAGEAGRRRYEVAGVGVREDALRIVGRPQVRRVQHTPPSADRDFTVMYAPTWEGVFRGAYDSSLVHSGRPVVQTLLDSGVRVVYRPHPKTGMRDPAFRTAHEDVLALLRRAGAPHRVSDPDRDDLTDDFNAVHALVADVSAVVSDFLASTKPYFVVNGAGLPDAEFRQRYPSSAGAYLVGPGGAGLAEGLADARGSDSLREQRLAIRTDLLGPLTEDPLELFRRAVDELAATAPGARPGAPG